MLEIQVGSVRATGPFITGQARVIVADYLDEALGKIAHEGAGMVRSLGMSQYKQPTGYYSSNVIARRDGPERYVIHDSMVVYGPWLEGVGSRNRSSRFKGYRTWRATRQDLRAKAPIIAIRVLKHHIRRLGG